MYYDEQITPLLQLEHLLRTAKFDGSPFFQYGIIIAINGTFKLHEMMNELYQKPYLHTARITQDPLERFFSIIRGMGGSCNDPSALEFLQRVKYYVTQKMLEDDKFDIFEVEQELITRLHSFGYNIIQGTESHNKTHLA